MMSKCIPKTTESDEVLQQFEKYQGPRCHSAQTQQYIYKSAQKKKHRKGIGRRMGEKGVVESGGGQGRKGERGQEGDRSNSPSEPRSRRNTPPAVRRLLDAMAVGTAAFTGERTTQLETGVHGHHLRQDLQHLLRDGLVVYRDEILGLRVHLQRLVEGEGCLDLLVGA